MISSNLSSKCDVLEITNDQRMKSFVEDCRPRHHRYCILYTSSTVVRTPVRKDGPTLVRHVRLCSTLYGFVRLVRNTRTRSIKSNRTVEQLSGPTCSTKVGPHTSPTNSTLKKEHTYGRRLFIEQGTALLGIVVSLLIGSTPPQRVVKNTARQKH